MYRHSRRRVLRRRLGRNPLLKADYAVRQFVSAFPYRQSARTSGLQQLREFFR